MLENERIREIRKAQNLTLERFGAMVGVQKSAISKIERGENAVSEQIRLSICRAFHVNEVWLRTGEGEMFLKGDDAIIAEVADKYHLSDLDKEAFKLYLKLDESERQVLTSYSFSLAGKILENPVLYREYKRVRGELPKLTPANIEVEVAAYRAELELLAQAQADDEEEYGEKAKALAMKQRASEKKPEFPASSANESAVG